jgi:hypothetical protein
MVTILFCLAPFVLAACLIVLAAVRLSAEQSESEAQLPPAPAPIPVTSAHPKLGGD